MSTMSVGRPRADHRAAADADAAETCALVCRLASDVPVQCLEQHVTQLQDVEREVEDEPGGRGAKPSAAALADRDAELGTAVGVNDVKQARGFRPARNQRGHRS